MKMESKTKQPIFPWYKERLQAKYLKAPDNKLSSSRCWCFTNTSLKDFSVCSLVTPGVDRRVSPLIFPGTQQHNSSQKPTKSISKEHACFSKQMIKKQIRGAYVASVEEKLKQHPLAMYPHYKDHLTPELFNRVVAVLDPDMCVSNASALPAPSEDLAEEEEEEDEENCRHPSKEEVVGSKQETAKPKMMNASGGAPSSRLFATNCAHSSIQQLLRLCIKSQPGRPFIVPKQELNSVQITNISEI